MKHVSFNSAMIFVVAVLSVVLTPSCVDADYELSEERLNTEVTLFKEGLSLPIGKTAPLTLSSLLDKLDEDTKDFLTSKDGAYLFRMAESFDMSEQMAGLSDMPDIEAVKIEYEDLPFNLSNTDLSGLKIDVGQIEPSEFKVADKLKIPEIELPSFAKTIDGVTAEIPVLKKSDLDLGFEALDMVHPAEVANYTDENAGFKLSDEVLEQLGPVVQEERDIAGLNSLLDGVEGAPKIPQMEIAKALDPYRIEVPVKISLPKGVVAVRDITLNENAVIKVDVAVKNTLFTQGEIDPDIDIDLHQIFHLRHGESGVTMEDHLKDKFTITADGGWKTSHTYHVESLAFTGSDFIEQNDGSLLLDKNITVEASADVKTTGLKTSIAHLHNHNDEPMVVTIDLKFVDVEIDNVGLEIEPLTINEEIDITVKDTELPELVNKVEYVDLKNPLALALNADVPSAYESLVSLKELEIRFPEGFVVNHEGFDNLSRTLVYENVKLAGGFSDNIVIDRLYLPEPTGRTLSYSGKVIVSATSENVVNSRDLMSDENSAEKTKTVSIGGTVNYAPELADYCALINDYEPELNIEPVSFKEELEGVDGLKKLSVFLEKEDDGRNPAVIIKLDYPVYDGIRILPKKNGGLKMTFAEEIVFEGLPAAYGYNPDDNSINFTGDSPIPSEIRLPISRLDITPEPEGGKYYVSGDIMISGGVRLAGMSVNKALIDQIGTDDAKVSFSMDVPVLQPAELNVGEYVALIDETIKLDDININDFPDMVKSVGDVILDDVYLNLEVDVAEAVEKLSTRDMTLKLEVKFPEAIVIKDLDANNVLKVEKSLDKDNKFLIGPYKVDKLNLSGVDFTAENVSLGDMNIEVDGQVILKNAGVDLGHVDDINIKINGIMASIGTEKIGIDRVNAVVDYQVDPVRQMLDLSSLSGGLSENMNFNLDLNRFNIVLEVKTNLGAPFNADLELVPFKDGHAQPEKAVRPESQLTLNYSQQARDTVYTKYWISNTDQGMPSDYEWVRLDLLQVLKDMPDSIQLSLNAGTPENADLIFEPGSEYALTANYALELPLELGNDFMLEFADTLKGLPSIVSDVLSYGSMALGGKVTSSLPVQLEVTFNLLDENGKSIEQAGDAGRTLINACHIDGSPSVSDLLVKLKVKEGVEIPDVSAIEMKFKATSGGHVGVFREDSSISVELNVQLPDGLTVDLKELDSFMEGEDEDDPQQ